MQHNSEEINNMIKKFESEAIELEQKYEQKLTSQYESLILKHRMEITEVEERKNAQIANLIKNHENAFTEMKNYYNDITLNNLSLIKSIKVNFIVIINFTIIESRKIRIDNFSINVDYLLIGTNGNDEKQ